MLVARLAAVLFLVAACQSGVSGGAPPAKSESESASAAAAPAAAPPAADAKSGYARDIDRICNADRYSGALAEDEGDRPLIVAQWLGSNLETSRAHEFLVKIQPLGGAAKADALEAEAKRMGVEGCSVAQLWRPKTP